MQNNRFEGMTKKQVEEKLSNRMVLNFTYAIMGLLALYFLWRGISNILVVLSMPYIMLALLVIAIAGTVACYILGNKKQSQSLKNHRYMLIGICIALFYLNFAFYTQWLPYESTAYFFRPILKFLKNTDYAYKVTALVSIIATVVVMVFNAIELYNFKNSSKK